MIYGGGTRKGSFFPSLSRRTGLFLLGSFAKHITRALPPKKKLTLPKPKNTPCNLDFFFFSLYFIWDAESLVGEKFEGVFEEGG